MSFDQNPPSPGKIVNPRKRTTKVNLGVALGVAIFLGVGLVLLWLVARGAR